MSENRGRKVQINQLFTADKESQSHTGLKRTGRPVLSAEIEAQLTGIGCRIRKSVSDGYQYQTSIPSYQGMTNGPVKTGSFQFVDRSSSRALFSTDNNNEFSQRHKRSRSDEDEDTDVDDDEHSENIRTIYHNISKPTSFQSTVSDDFEEADFLVPRDEVG